MPENSSCKLDRAKSKWRAKWAFSILAIASPLLATAGAAPEIVISRDMPQHDAFRPGDKGQASTVATARPDLVLANTKQTEGVPQTMSDAMLGTVGSMPGHSLAERAGANQTSRGSGSNQMNFINAPASSGVITSIESGMLPAAGIGAMVNRSMAPLGSALQAIPGMK